MMFCNGKYRHCISVTVVELQGFEIQTCTTIESIVRIV